MSDYNLVSVADGAWLSPEQFRSALTEAYPATEVRDDVVPTAPVALWAYVPDGAPAGPVSNPAGQLSTADTPTAEVSLDATGRMITFADISRGLAAELVALFVNRFPSPGGLQLWRWAPAPLDVCPGIEPGDLLT